MSSKNEESASTSQPVKRSLSRSSEDSDNSSTSSRELIWKPRPYYFCAKCLIALGLPEPAQDNRNYLVNKKVVEEDLQLEQSDKGSNESTSNTVTKSIKRHQVQQPAKNQKGKKKIRLLLDDE